MKTVIQTLMKLIILGCVILGVTLIIRTRQEKKASEATLVNGKALVLKKFLLQYPPPARIETSNLTKKFEADVEEIKTMKMQLNPESKFYVTIQFFTDETDAAAPLVAQIRFLDVQTNNVVKEESINLD